MPVRTQSAGAALSLLLVGTWSCSGRPAAEDAPGSAATASPAPATRTEAADDAAPADDGFAARAPRSAAALKALLPSNATGRARRQVHSGRVLRPSIRQRSIGGAVPGRVADFIVPRNTSRATRGPGSSRT